MIRWREVKPTLHEARVIGDGPDLYVGYVARTPPSPLWRGYVGVTHTPVGTGALAAVREAVERRALGLLARHTHQPDAAEDAPRDPHH